MRSGYYERIRPTRRSEFLHGERKRAVASYGYCSFEYIYIAANVTVSKAWHLSPMRLYSLFFGFGFGLIRCQRCAHQLNFSNVE